MINRLKGQIDFFTFEWYNTKCRAGSYPTKPDLQKGLSMFLNTVFLTNDEIKPVLEKTVAEDAEKNC